MQRIENVQPHNKRHETHSKPESSSKSHVQDVGNPKPTFSKPISLSPLKSSGSATNASGAQAEKVCIGCGLSKPLDKFYRDNRRSKIRYDARCKICRRAMQKAWKLANVARVLATHKKSRMKAKKDPARIARKFNQTSVWKKNNQAKVRAYAAVKIALDNGKLTRQPCEICGLLPGISKGKGRASVVAVHDDYAKPLAVRWLCQPHAWDRRRAKKLEHGVD